MRRLQRKKIENLTNKLFHLLHKLINRSDFTVKTINLSNELVETLKIIESCINCKHKRKEEYYFDGFHESINEIEYQLVELEKGERKKKVNGKRIV